MTVRRELRGVLLGTLLACLAAVAAVALHANTGRTPAPATARFLPARTAAIRIGASSQRRLALSLIDPLRDGRHVWAAGPFSDCAATPSVGGSSPPAPCGSAIVASADGGASWQVVFASSAFVINRLHFVNAEDGFAVAQAIRCGWTGGSDPDRACAALLWRTQDGGRTWQTVLNQPGRGVSALFAAGPNHVWVVTSQDQLATPCGLGAEPACRQTLLATPDGGKNWVVQYTGTLRTVPASLVTFLGEQGWMLLGSGQVLHSSDGGRTWSPWGALPHSRQLFAGGIDMEFLDTSHGWLTLCNTGTAGNGGCQNTLYGTADGGRTWTRLWSQSCIQWSRIDMVTQLRGYLITGGFTACQAPGQPSENVLETVDGGLKWRRVDHVPAVLTRAEMAGGRLWAVGRVNCVTFDISTCPSEIMTARPETWQWHMIEPLGVPNFGLALVGSRLVGLALQGPRDTLDLMRSDDSGRTWLEVGTLPALPAGMFPGPLHAGAGLIWLHAHSTGSTDANGGLMVSANGGRTWRWRPLPSIPTSLSNVQLTGTAAAWAAGPVPGCTASLCDLWPYRSVDGGARWIPLPKQRIPLRMLAFAPVGDRRAALLTVPADCQKFYLCKQSLRLPGGALPLPAPASPFEALAHPAPQVYIIVGERLASEGGPSGVVLETTDGGRTWTVTDLLGLRPAAAQFSSAKVGLIRTQSGKFYLTTDGGAEWTEIG